MSYWRPGIWSTFRTRLTGDTTLTTALGGSRVFFNEAPPALGMSTGGTTSTPWITFNMASCVFGDTFGGVLRAISLDFHLWTDLRVSGVDTLNQRASILERINGDWDESGGPTYGLHRWTPGQIGSTGWYLNTVVCSDERDLSTLELGHDVYTVTVEVYKAKA